MAPYSMTHTPEPVVELVPGRMVGGAFPTFFLAEAGLNHNGDVELAKQLITRAKAAGADAVKFQKRTTTAILTKAALDAPYCSMHAYGATYGAHRDALELPEAAWRELKAHADAVGIPLTASGWDEASVDFLDALGVPFFKVASADLLNFPLLAHTASKGKPLVISTGMAAMDDVRRAVAFLRGHTDRIVLCHCTSTYHVNLRAIQTFIHEFPDIVIGYSGHENGVAIGEAAAVLGAQLVERHFTLDRTMKGGDHAASLEPRGFTELVERVRKIESALGDGVKRVMPGEEAAAAKLRKSLVARRPIPAGAVITADDLCAKGPGTGVPPADAGLLLGRVAAVDIEADTIVRPEQLRERGATCAQQHFAGAVDARVPASAV